MGRWPAGRFVAVPGATDEVVPAEQYFDRDFLTSAIARAGEPTIGGSTPELLGTDGDSDVNLRVAVSRFTRHYAGALTFAAAVGLVHGVGLDLSPQRCRMVVHANLAFRLSFAPGVPAAAPLVCDEHPTEWPIEGERVSTMAELRWRVWETLYGDHLGPLFARVHEVTRVTDNVIWTNAAEWWGMASDAAEEYLTPAVAQRYVAERVAALSAAELPGVPGPNPLAGRLDWQPTGYDGFPREIHTRHSCCLTYLLSDRLGRLCQNCPFLPFDDRVALIVERHGVPMGAPGGPAERVSIERGLEKVRSHKTSAT